MEAYLADYFPDGLKREYVENQICPGTVLKLYCNFPVDPHDKFLIILHKDKRPLFFLINSVINEFINLHPDLRNCQLEIKRIPNHKFLDYDSWIDCSKVQNLFEYEEIVSILLRDFNRIVGKIDKEITKNICEIVNKENTKTISELHKKIILANLNEN